MKGRPSLYTLCGCTFRFDSLKAVSLGEKGQYMIWVHLYIAGLPEPVKVHAYYDKYAEMLNAWRGYYGESELLDDPVTMAVPKQVAVDIETVAPGLPSGNPVIESIGLAGTPWDKHTELELLADWKRNITVPNLAMKYGRSEEAIKHRLRKLGIKTPASARKHKAKSFLRS